MLVGDSEPPVEGSLYDYESRCDSELIVLLILCVLVFDVGDLLVHDSIDEETDINADDSNNHLESFLVVNTL